MTAEAGATMTDEKALRMIRQGIDYLRQQPEQTQCSCGSCFLCAYNHLAEALTPAEPEPAPRVIVLVDGGVVQYARASVPVDLAVWDKDNQREAKDDELFAINELEAEYKKLPEAIY